MRKQVLPALAGLAVLSAPVVAFAATKPPTVSTSPADPSSVTDTYALLSGVVNPNGANTSYWFEWGTTTAYAQSTPATNAGAGTADVPVDVSLDGLTPHTVYHFRIVAQPAGSTDPSTVVDGPDVAFITANALTLRIVGGQAPVSGGRAKLSVHCLGPVDDTCQGHLNLHGTVGGRSVGFGSGPYSVDVGKANTVGVVLSPAALKALTKARNHHARVTATTKPSGSTATTTKQLILAR